MLNQIGPQTGIVPLSSNASRLCFDTLKPGLEPVLVRPEQEAAQAELQDPPSLLRRRLRIPPGEMESVQVVKDRAGRVGYRADVTVSGFYHRYNAGLKRVAGNKSQARMTPTELKAVRSRHRRGRCGTSRTRRSTT